MDRGASIQMNQERHFVIDNFLPPEQFISIRNAVMGEQFAWYYSGCVAADGVEAEDYYFVHTFFDNDEVLSSAFSLLECVITKLNVNTLLRVKANMYPNVNKFIHNDVHRDQGYPHNGAVFYLNTNNGATVLEGGVVVPSVENRILLFNSSTPHNSTNATDVKRRITINFNYL
jgi:hypothetical protein